MKRIAIKFLIAFLLITGAVVLLNTEVTYQQGINFKVSSVRIPLYLKISGFFDRHYNYKNLVSKIIKESDNHEERVMKIFNWTYNNIRWVPEGYPVIDDHVWHIIVRGYGTNDQFSDVFTTLCNYAKVDAFFEFIYTKDNLSVIPLSFARLNNQWRVFDPYGGIYFQNKAGNLASLDQIKNGDWVAAGASKNNAPREDYKIYFANMPFFKDIGLRRANIQSPWRRFLFEAGKWTRK